MTRRNIILLTLIAVGLIFAELIQYGTGFAGKTLWDWLGILIVPIVLLIGGVLVNSSIQRSERERADDQRKEQVLQTYFDRMSEMLLSGQFEKADTQGNAKIVARARTLTTLQGLDGKRKGAILQFLYESKLITDDTPIISLAAADFSRTSLKVALKGVDLRGAELLAAIPHIANLKGANLRGADLAGAELPGAFLHRTNLMQTNFVGAHLEGAQLPEANLSFANLKGVNFEPLEVQQVGMFAITNLAGAHLEGARLEEANLRKANLNGTHLEEANLTGAKITQKQLDEAILDESTILPDGSHYKPPVTPKSSP